MGYRNGDARSVGNIKVKLTDALTPETERKLAIFLYLEGIDIFVIEHGLKITS